MTSKLLLPNVTLFGIHTKNAAGLMRAAEISQKEIEFGNVRLITSKIFPDDTRHQAIQNYSIFMVKDLYKQFFTSHVLVIQPDGYVQNASAWKDEWLELDFLGGPWEWYEDKKVGNGGFSLRSRRLCEILANDQNIREVHPEDDKICRYYHDYLVDTYGIKFGTLEQAREFSIEAWNVPIEQRVYKGQFGFHGPHVRNVPIPYQFK